MASAGTPAARFAGPLTRRYHGLLLAALKPPVGRTLMLAAFEEVASYLGAANRWHHGTIAPRGYAYIEPFAINTLPMMQRVLARPEWPQRMTPLDFPSAHAA